MSFFLNYQKILKRIEQKAQAKSKKLRMDPSDEIFILDGGKLKLFTSGSVYLESTKTDKKKKN